jgi:hypothetical protein
MQTSHQIPRAGMEEAHASIQPFFIEIEESVFKRLTNLATKERIGINELASALIKCLLLLHRTEVKRIIEEVRRNHKCPVS